MNVLSMRRVRDVPLWVWWIPVVLIISIPWTGSTSHPQWSRVHPIPFTDPADRPRDFVANVLLFLPFGYSFGRRGRWWMAIVAAALVSFTAESTQLYSTDRFPSATDVAAALCGSAAGAISACVHRKRVGLAQPF
jgi:glycopeptide antibiotics resistance protein